MAIFNLFRRRTLRRFARDRKGATAVEFGLIAIPFFVMLVGLGEVSIMQIAQTNLDMAVGDAARRVRTGEVQTNEQSASQVSAEICTNLNRLITVECSGNLFLDVRTYESFNAVANPNPIVNGAVDPDGVEFDPGGPGDIVLVRGLYRWEIITPFFSSIFGNMAGGDRLLVSSILVRNEPYPVEDEGAMP